MRILKDADGDLWEETSANWFECRTTAADGHDLEWIRQWWSPINIYGQASEKDTSTYQITYDDGGVKHGNRRVLAAVVGSRGQGYRDIAKIERAADITWTDVTSEFVTVLR